MNKNKNVPAGDSASVKKRSPVLIDLGTASIIYGINVLGVIGTGAVFNWIWVCGGAVLVLLGLFWCKIRIAAGGWPKGLRIAVIALLAVALICFVFVEGRIIKFAGSTPKPEADYIVVLGAKTKTTGPSREFAARIRAAVDYMKANPDAVAVLTGGQGADEPEAESLAARNMMIQSGIDESRILWEDRSTSTYENLSYARDLMEKDMAKRYSGSEPVSRDGFYAKVVVVSSQFHLYRASKLCRQIGIENASFLGTNGLALLIPHYYVREFFAVVKDSL